MIENFAIAVLLGSFGGMLGALLVDWYYRRRAQRLIAEYLAATAKIYYRKDAVTKLGQGLVDVSTKYLYGNPSAYKTYTSGDAKFSCSCGVNLLMDPAHVCKTREYDYLINHVCTDDCEMGDR